tara:strand:- start:3025 stop:4731 length:1707 start_codon:yes stop_codon:yes gene_type:complete
MKPLLYLAAIFYFFSLLLTPLGFNFSFSPAGQEPRGIYHVLHFDSGDDAGYYAYLKSLFIDHDLDFFNEPYYIHRYEVMDTGYIVNPWKIGPGILWFPFFFLAHLQAKIYNLIGIPLSLHGLSFPYVGITALASSAYAFMGLILNYLILRRWFSSQAAFFSILLLFATTGLIYFSFIRSRMPHACDYFLINLFIYMWLGFRESPDSTRAVSVGLVGGIMLLTRINSAGYFLFPIYDLIFKLTKAIKLGQKLDRSIWRSYALIFSIAFLVYSIQLFINHIISGSWSPIPSVGGYNEQIFSIKNWLGIFSQPIKLIFGDNWGLLWHAPIYLFGGVGFYFFSRNYSRQIVGPLFLSLSFPIFLFLLWPHHGMSYGQRHLLTSNVLFSFGVGCLYDHFHFRFKSLIWSTMTGLLIFWSYIQLCLFKIVIHHETQHFVGQVFSSLNIFKSIPSLFLRSDNIFYIISQFDVHLQTPLDWYLMVVYPLQQFGVIIIILFATGYVWSKMRNYVELKLAFRRTINMLTISFLIGLHLMVQVQSDQKSPEFIAKRKSYVAKHILYATQKPHDLGSPSR